MPTDLDRARIDATIQAAADRLSGDWLLLGGALVALWLEPRRVTEDIDLVGFSDTTADRLALMQLAQDLGLPIEAVNSAADFFVKRIPDWRAQVELFRQGTRARIFRPTPTLFVLLKLRRLSSQDLTDCLTLLERVGIDSLPLDRARLLSELDGLPSAPDEALRARRAQLAQVLRT